MADNIDIIGKLTGDFGKWQLRSLLILFLCKIPTSWFMAIIIYTAPAPKIGDFWCKPPQSLLIDNNNNNNNNRNSINHTEWLRLSHPTLVAAAADGSAAGSKQFNIDFCNVYKDVYDDKEIYYQHFKNTPDFTLDQLSEFNRNRSIIPCDDFHHNVEHTSIITEFNLVCSKKLLVQLSQSSHIFGLLIGGIIVYFLMKIFSPRRLMLIGMLSQIITGNLCGWINFFGLHVLFRTLAAVSCAFMYSSAVVIINDITLGKSRTISIVLFDLFWSIGLILLPALTIFINNWTYLYMMISLPTCILMFLHRLIPDSPRWMLQHGQLQKVKTILIKAANTNKIKIPNDIDHLILLQENSLKREPPPKKWVDLWNGKPGKCVLLAVHYSWALCIVLFNAMVLNIVSYGPDHVKVNTMVIGLSEMLGVFIGLYLILYTKRKWLWSGLFSITTGLFAYTVWGIPGYLKLSHSVTLTMIPCILIKMSTSVVLSILTSSTGELVTADKKKILGFSVGVWSRAWFFWAPFIGALRVYGSTIPLTVFATISIIIGTLFSYIYFGTSKNLNTKLKANGSTIISAEKDELLLRPSNKEPLDA